MYRRRLVSKGKPVVIKAIQFDGKNLLAIREFFDTNAIYDTWNSHPDEIYVRTALGSRILVRKGEWVVPDGKRGCFRPLDPNVFERIYEQVDE